MLPVEGLLLAGNYGIEYMSSAGQEVKLQDLTQVRAVLDEIARRWAALIAGRAGFHLEDKGYALAIHASRADRAEAEPVLAQARAAAQEQAGPGVFRILAVPGFLEIAPDAARKSYAVETFLREAPWPVTRPAQP